MPDALGIQDQGVNQEGTSLDYLGIRSPTAFKGQPALPSGAGAPAAGAAAPPATGAGITPAVPRPGLQPTASGDRASATFLDLANAAPGGGGAPGAGEGGVAAPDVGAGQFESFSTQAGPFGLSGNPFGLQGSVGPFALNLGLGGLSPSLNLTNDPALNAAINTAGKQTLGFAGLPSSLTLSAITNLANAPALAQLFAGAVGAMSPFAIMSLIHNLAVASPSTIAGQAASLQGQINSVMADPQLTPEMQAQMLADITQQLQSVNAQGPRSGGPQAIGSPQAVAAGIDNPVTNVAGSTQAAPTSISPNFSTFFGDLANALGFGREDIGAPPTGPTGPGSTPASPGAEGPTGLGEGGPPGGPSGTAGGPADSGTTGGEGPGTPDF